MDPKKKKIYIILIIVCFALSAGILLWSSFGSSGSIDEIPQATFTPTSSAAPVSASGDAQTGYLPPSVFPKTETFQSDVLTSPKFQALQPYSVLDVTGQLGRPDPFKSY
jgi:hypothetical protein